MTTKLEITEDYLGSFRENIETQLILKKRQEVYLLRQSSNGSLFSDYVRQLTKFKSKYIQLNSPVVRVGRRDELTVSQYLDLQYGLRLFSPWKKGPFSFFETAIDSEWRSDLKWQRIRPWIWIIYNLMILHKVRVFKFAL